MEGIWKHIENFCNSALLKASSYLYHFHNVSPYLPHFPNVACGMSVKSLKLIQIKTPATLLHVSKVVLQINTY